ncbi:protein FAM204A [Eucyclogobius newberryi]|uniref:protein FAM204A n=1 Tax=Eucyclogobius newberryi TaxID=166745 RepID=UPI003B5BD817
MYSGLLPEGLTEEELSPDEEEEEEPRKLISKEQSKAASAASASVSSSVDSVSACDASSDAQSSLPGISQEMWQKFKVLQKKKEEAKIIEVPRRRRKRRKKKGTVSKRDQPEDDRAEQKKKERERHWDELKQYFGSNDRFQPPSCFKPPPKSGLEKSIERAIAEGDVAKAEEMSDSLATRELAVQIAQAADCRDYAKRKQEEDDLRASQKRKREIAWGFEAKQRWETKSNMGFM